ncbi:transporter substrate-binding domain-containing protein [Leucobacter ruminantium]|uniref:ABC transporter substrate-binding protein n=1 Tax=Leucobacter ruminantium TaxID=1289170 RepID=A0A939LXF3_9MICO|nr:ABC transporter substrate-binding protein [Leucobacter ruminantium]
MKLRTLAPLLAAALLLVGCADNSADEAAVDAPAGEVRSWQQIRESGVLRVGTITDYPPNEFKTDDGRPTGWAVELVEAIADDLGLEVEYELLLFDNILPRIEGGAIDIGVGSFTDTRERQEVVDFVNYYEAGSLWAAPAGSDVDPEHACGLSVAVMSGGTQHLVELPERSAACEAAGEEPIEILPFTGQPEVTNAVVGGKADAFSADSPVTIDAIGALDGELEAVGELFDAAPYGLPVAKGSELAEPVRESLQRLIDDGTYEALLREYRSEAGAIERATINVATE